MSAADQAPGPQADQGAQSQLPLVVDLDGTLVRTDLLVETFFLSLAERPASALGALRTLLGDGRSAFKHALASRAESLDAAALPYHEPLLDYLRAQKASGRELALVSASDQALVDRVARHLKLFDWQRGSSADLNLKGQSKADWLASRLPGGYVYAGDSRADLAVWRRARGAVPVGASDEVLRQLRKTAPIERHFDRKAAGVKTWARALRLHQWVKNTLILIPLFLSGLFVEPVIAAKVLAGLVAFSLIASGGYLFNDLLDLQTDRAHPTKRERPLAAGSVDIFAATLACIVCLVCGLLGLIALSGQAAVLALCYLAGTLAYSLCLKRLALIDLVTLATLFTLRVAVGTALIGAAYSTWLLMFSMFFFFSLSAVKRVGELKRVGTGGARSRRGYSDEDHGMLQAFGISFAASSLVIFVLYLENEALIRGNYPSPAWLWLAPPAILLWLCRLWSLATRGDLHDDPVVFSTTDPASLAIGGGLAFSVLAAHLL